MDLSNFYDNSDHVGTKPAEQKPADTAPVPVDVATPFDEPKDDNEDERDYESSTDEDRAVKLFGDTLHNETHLIPTDTEGVDGGQLAQANQIFRVELKRVGVLNPKVGEELADILQEAWHSPLSDAELAQEQTQTAGELAHTYGVDGARERIDLAKAVLARSPMLKNAVEVLELGNSYDLIEKLAEVGRELRKAGKLK